MVDPRKESRIRHGLIPVLIAMRVKAERDRREAEAAKKAGVPNRPQPKPKRGWFR